MKTLFSVLALLLVFLMVPGQNAMSFDKPHRPVSNEGIDGGDDHPWGGENKVGDVGLTGRGHWLRTAFGIPALDLIFSIPKLRDCFDARPRKIRHRLNTRIERSQIIHVTRVQGRSSSQNRSGRVSK